MIEIICGTNRPDSVSAQVARFYERLLTTRRQACKLLDLSRLPADFTVSALYDNNGTNPEFNLLTDRLNKADKFVFVVPEYNGSFPGVLKAFIDGMPYPSPFSGKKCALVGLSSGVQGAGLALSHLTDIFNYLGMHVLAQKVRLANIETHFQEDNFSNSLYQELLEDQVEALAKF
jgi:NAD(P)H-dependent FMN reductase